MEASTIFHPKKKWNLTTKRNPSIHPSEKVLAIGEMGDGNVILMVKAPAPGKDVGLEPNFFPTQVMAHPTQVMAPSSCDQAIIL